MPVPWFQAIDGLSPFICLPPMLMFWRWQAKRGREPREFTKAAIGCFIFGAATLWLAAAGLVTDASGRSPILWAVVFHLVSNLGWLYFVPTMVALFTRAAPVSVVATLVGLNMLSTTIGSFASKAGGSYETWTPAPSWTRSAALVGLGGDLPGHRLAFSSPGSASSRFPGQPGPERQRQAGHGRSVQPGQRRRCMPRPPRSCPRRM